MFVMRFILPLGPLIRTMLADVSLTLVSTGEERAFMRDGAPLSDHPAVFARFRVAAKR